MKEEIMVEDGIQFCLPLEFYETHLRKINNVKFRRREIDIVAFMLNGRSGKKTASFLSLSPKTVGNYTHNIMSRLECNSREAIIDFVEKSGQVKNIRKYYSILLAQDYFESKLKQIDIALSKGKRVSVALYCQQSQKHRFILEEIERHLKILGIDVLLEVLEKDQSFSEVVSKNMGTDYLIYAVPSLSEAVAISPILNRLAEGGPSEGLGHQAKGVFFLFLEGNVYVELPTEEGSSDCLRLLDYKNYYLFFFDIIKRLLPELTLETTIEDFNKKTLELLDPSAPFSHGPLESEKDVPANHLSSAIYFLRQKKWLVTSLMLLGLSVITGHHFLKEESQEHSSRGVPTLSIQSDLPIPADSMLIHRPALIHQIHRKLQEKPNSIQTIALFGIGGAGKTTIARQYARQQKGLVWEINAETKDSLIASFKLLAHALAKTEEERTNLKRLEDIPNIEEKEEKILQWVKESLKIRKGWLLLYENLKNFNDIQHFFPLDTESWGNGNVIITTRDSNIQQISHINHFIQLGELTSQERFDLFSKLMTNNGRNPLSFSEQKQVGDFLEAIPPFPLDICSSAYYIKATHITYKDYLNYLRYHPHDFDSLQENIFKEVSGYEKTRFHILTLSLKQILKIHSDFSSLFLFVCLIDSENIPKIILDNYKTPVVVDNFIYNLKKFSLINLPTKKQTSIGSIFSIHRSIQDICRLYLISITDQNSNLIFSIGMSLKDELSKSINNEDLPKMIILANHAEVFLSHKKIIKDEIVKLISGDLGIIYFFLGDFIKSKRLLKYSLDSLKNNNHIELNQVAQMLSYAGIVDRELGNYDEAKHSLRQSLEIYNQNRLNDPVGKARTLLYLGMLARELGDFEKALEFLKQSYEIYQSKLPDNYVGIARAVGYLGIIDRELGHYEEAKKLLDQSVITYEKYMPNNKSGVAWALTHLGKLYKDIGKYEQAKQLTERALKIFQADLPDNQLAWVFVYLAGIYKEMELFEQAKTLLEKSQNIYRETLPENHVYHAWILGILGGLNKQLGKYQDAKECCDKAFHIYEKYYGRDHIENARLLNEIGHIALLENRLQDAEKTLNVSLNIFEKNNHPERSFSLELLSKVYLKKSILNGLRKEESYEYKKQAISYLMKGELIMEQHFPKDSSHLKRIRSTILSIH